MNQKDISFDFGKLTFTHVHAIGNNQVNNSQYFIVTASDNAQRKKKKAVNLKIKI